MHNDDGGPKTYKVFTMEYIIKKLLDYGEDSAKARIHQISQWKLKSTENVLKSFL